MIPLMEAFEYGKPQQNRSDRFLIAFYLAYPFGMVVLEITCDVFAEMAGSYSGGSAVVLSLVACPFLALTASVIRRVRKRYDTVEFAVAFAIFAPLLCYLVWGTVTVYCK